MVINLHKSNKLKNNKFENFIQRSNIGAKKKHDFLIHNTKTVFKYLK